LSLAEILNLDELLDAVRPFKPVGRVLLATAGTLQTTLAAYFCTPIDVCVLDQKVMADSTITRKADLVRRDIGRPVCHTSATVMVDREDVRSMVLSQMYGLGHILVLCGINAKFDLVTVGKRPTHVWRVYRLTAPGVSYQILEEFPRSAFANPLN
jgi:hypothetical protein